MAPAPPAPPPLNIPDSESTVQVHIINTTTRIRGIAPSLFLEPEIKGFDREVFDLPAYSFLIQHAGSGHKFLFDLGARTDWENLAPTVVDRIKRRKWHVEVEKGVADILEEGGVGRADINAIIWRLHLNVFFYLTCEGRERDWPSYQFTHGLFFVVITTGITSEIHLPFPLPPT